LKYWQYYLMKLFSLKITIKYLMHSGHYSNFKTLNYYLQSTQEMLLEFM